MTGKIDRRRALPSPAELERLFRYEDGCLYWRPREETSGRVRYWNSRFAGQRAGGVQPNGYRAVCVENVRFLEHRLIYQMILGPVPAEAEIDHRDTDRLNNRIENLRACLHAQNAMNSGARGARELPKHVYWSTLERRYKVQLRANGSTHHIGTFLSLDEASAAAAEARARLHGEFARVTR